MSHAIKADELLIKPAAGARPAPPHHPHRIPTARKTASHKTSHKQHGDTRLATASVRPTCRVSQSPDAPSVTAPDVTSRGGVWTLRNNL